VNADSNGKFEMTLPEGVEIYINLHIPIRPEDADKHLGASLTKATLKKFRRQFKGKPWKRTTFFNLKPLKGPIGPLDIQILPWQPDERSFTEKLWDGILWGE